MDAKTKTLKKELMEECLTLCNEIEDLARTMDAEKTKELAKRMVALESNLAKVIETDFEATMTEEMWVKELSNSYLRHIIHWLEGVGMDLRDDLRVELV